MREGEWDKREKKKRERERGMTWKREKRKNEIKEKR